MLVVLLEVTGAGVIFNQIFFHFDVLSIRGTLSLFLISKLATLISPRLLLHYFNDVNFIYSIQNKNARVF